MEHTFDATWATCLGVDVEKLIVIHPDTGEQAVDAIEALMRTRDVGLLVLDSVAALIPFKVQDTSAEDNDTPGIHAKLVTKLMSKVNSALLAESKRGHYPTMLCTNQYRSGIGMWAPPGQEALKFTGGKAYEHYLSSRVIFKNKENLERDEHGIDTLSYNEHAFRIDKNKFNAGTRAGEFQMVRRAGVVEPLTAGDLDDASTLVSIAKKMKVYDGGGRSWALDLPGESIKVGKADELVAMLYEDKDLHDRLYAYLVALHCRKIGLPDYHVKRIHPDA
jgi:recombination protein RecA